MSKTHGSDICGVRGSIQDIRIWSNNSWQLWLVKCLTSQFIFFLQSVKNEHEILDNKDKRHNSSPGIPEQGKTFKLPWPFTTIFILPWSSTHTKSPCAVNTLCKNSRENSPVEEDEFVHTERPQSQIWSLRCYQILISNPNVTAFW